MSLNWKWSEKIGEATIEYTTKEEEATRTVTLYQGNAFLIMLNEHTENGEKYWSMFSFFADREHAKNCLGLSKDRNNIFDDAKTGILTKVKINKKKYSYTKDLVGLLIKAFPAITIEIYSE